MILYLPGLIYGIVLILAASRELQTKEHRPLTALLSMGLTQFEPLWQAVEALIARLNPFDEPGFDRRNPVHRVAGLLLIAQVILFTWQVFSNRGSTVNTFFAVDIGGLLLSMAASVVIYLSLSALGTGWRIRRDWREVLQRLGLRTPTPRDCLAGLTFGFLIFVGVSVATLIVLSAAPADQFGAQMDGSRPLFEIVKGSLPAALLVAILAGTGEEILFRGALQPGVWLVCFGVHIHHSARTIRLEPRYAAAFFRFARNGASAKAL